MSDKKKILSLIGQKDYATPIERILKSPQRLFISLVAHKEIKKPEKRTMPKNETLIFIADNFEPGES